MRLFRTFVLACSLLLSAEAAQAFAIPFSGTIGAAILSSGIGDYAPVFDSSSYTGVVATNASNQFYVSLDLPHFTSDGPGCSAPNSGCGPFSAGGTFTVTDDGSVYSHHVLSQSGDILTFSVFNAPEGSFSGTLNLKSMVGQIAADIYVGQAFRADNRADLSMTLTVNAVPLPSTAPLFGAALLLFGVAGYGIRREGNLRV